MKSLKIINYVGVAVLATLGVVMAVSNPDQPAYEDYAVQRLVGYLKSDVCTKAPKIFEDLLQRNCTVLIDSGRPQIQKLVSESTRRQNFIFFSIYSTNLSVNPLIPSYQFETVAAFQNFYTYSAEKQ